MNERVNTALIPSYAPPQVYREGWEAALAGRSRRSCLYVRQSSWWRAWHVGYDDALAEREKDRPNG